MNDVWNRCQVCGQFISFEDIAEGRALHEQLEPDSDLGVEKWVTECPTCLDPGGLA